MRRLLISALLVLQGWQGTALAGTFVGADTDPFEPYVVVHSPGYDGTGGVLEVGIYADRKAQPSLERAITVWNELQRSVQNCTSCRLWEQGPGTSEEPSDLTTVLIHELGHCAFGLDHTNWVGPGATPSSYTATRDASSITNGADGFIGTKDDVVTPLPGARLIHWFRKDTNDPLTPTEFTVDSSTYSRRIIDLPAGSSWPANGNFVVGLVLLGYDGPGVPVTQAVMYSVIDRPTRYFGLAADEVNTVLFAQSGLDEIAGTPDDYTVELAYVADCADAVIEVQFTELMEGSIGQCSPDLESLAPPGELAVYHRLVPPNGERLLLELNSSADWGFLFDDGFEAGNIGSWSGSEP